MKKLFFACCFLFTLIATAQTLIEEEAAKYYKTTFSQGIAQTNSREIIRIDSFLYYLITYQKPGYDSIQVSYRNQRFARLYFYFRNESAFNSYLSYCQGHYKRKSDKVAAHRFLFYNKKERKHIVLYILTPETAVEKRYMILIYDDKNSGKV